MRAHPELVVAWGKCDAQAAGGLVYLPFQDVLAMLCGDVESLWAARAIDTEHARRLWRFMPIAAKVLSRQGPHLLDHLLAADEMVERLATVAAEDTEVKPLVAQLAARRPQRITSRQTDLVAEQLGNVLRSLSRERPLLIVLEDLHWADATSIELLFHLAQRGQQSRLFLLGTHRPEEIGAQGSETALAGVVAELRRQRGNIVVDLDRAMRREARSFVNALLDLEPNQFDAAFRDAFLHHTSGHPLFCWELLRTLHDTRGVHQDAAGTWVATEHLDWRQLPPKVVGLITRRVERLDAPLRQLLEATAVQGETFVAQVLSEVLDQDELVTLRALTQVLHKQHGLVRKRGEQTVAGKRLLIYAFSHACYQQYVYRGLSRGEQYHLHARTAISLESLYEGCLDRVAATLATHYRELGDRRNQLAYLLVAGDDAARRRALQDAVVLYDQALAVAEQVAPGQRFQILLAREEILHHLGLRQEQARDLAVLEQLALASGNIAQRAEVLLRRSRYAFFTGDPEATITIGLEALPLAETVGDPVLVSELLLFLGMAHMYSLGARDPGLQTAAKFLSRALEIAQRAELDVMVIEVSRRLAWIDMLGNRHHRAFDRLEEARQRARQQNDVLAEFLVIQSLGTIYMDLCRFVQAADHYMQALEIGEQLGLRWLNTVSRINLASARLNQGLCNHQTAALLQEGLAVIEEAGHRDLRGGALCGFGSLYSQVGILSKADSYLAEAVDCLHPPSHRENECFAWTVWSLIALRRGDHGAAVARAEKALQIARRHGRQLRQGQACLALGHALAASTAHERAQAMYEEAIWLLLEADQAVLATEPTAGLAALHLDAEELEAAHLLVEQILPHLQAEWLNGVQEPSCVAWTCYRVLAACGDERAPAVLIRCHAFLERQCRHIDNDAWRRSFLSALPASVAIQTAYQDLIQQTP